MKSKSTTTFIVECADFEIDGEKSPFDPSKSIFEQSPAVPSTTEIDDRTIKTYHFSSKKAAINRAKKIIKDHEDCEKWLAYVEVKECRTKLIQKLK